MKEVFRIEEEEYKWRKKNGGRRMLWTRQGTDINGGRRMLHIKSVPELFSDFPPKNHIFFKFLTYPWVKSEEQEQPVILLLATG